MNPFQTESIKVQDQLKESLLPPRACLFTLIVVATDLDKGARCQELVQLLSKKFPCKIIFTVVDTLQPENTLLTNRSIMTTMQGGDPISCDLLTIQASPDEVHTIPFLILPEILADLPSFLLSAESPLSLPNSFRMLEPYIDKALFEISEIETYIAHAGSLLSFAEKIPLVDLHWTRIEPWRVTLARVFHSASKLEPIHKIEKIELRYTSRKNGYGRGSEIQGILLQAWLATRLGWSLEAVEKKDGKLLLTYKTVNDHFFTLQLLSSNPSFLEEGMVESVEITSIDGFHFLMTYENDDRHIVVHSSSPDRCELPLTFFVGNLQRGAALSSEMFQSGISSHYLPLLECFNNRLWEKIGKKKSR